MVAIHTGKKKKRSKCPVINDVKDMETPLNLNHKIAVFNISQLLPIIFFDIINVLTVNSHSS